MTGSWVCGIIIAMDPTYYTSRHQKAKDQLGGMNPRTASHQLNRDIIYHLLVETGRSICPRCNIPLNKDSWSVEHIREWLDDPNPIFTFFDISNIAIVCKRCNSTYNRGRFDVRRSGIPLVKPVLYEQPKLREEQT